MKSTTKEKGPEGPFLDSRCQESCEFPLPLLVCRPVFLQAAGSFTHSLSNRLAGILANCGRAISKSRAMGWVVSWGRPLQFVPPAQRIASFEHAWALPSL